MADRLPANDKIRRIGFGIAILVYAVDQLIKWLIVGPLGLPGRPVGTVNILPVFRLQWVENHGISMGFLTAGSA